MEKHIVDEKTGISYTLQGDYYIPDLTLPDEDKTIKIGIWGIRHKRYLLEHKKEVVTIMQMNGTLQTYLADINEQAEDMYIRLVKEMANAEGVTEQLKAENQMLWVQKMNNICNRVREIIDDELIYS
ncbi:MAG: TnpV protein [Ruminococcus sp.]|nr:TnpV protein [Candidatus Copronaster equi]